MKRPFGQLFLCLVASFLSIDSVNAVGAPQEVEVPEAAVVPVVDLAKPVELFAVQLRPMRKAELEKQLENWLIELQSQISETAEYTYRLRSGELSKNDQLVFRNKERDSRVKELEVAKRVKIVIVALEAKGGDVIEATSYLKSATDISGELNPSGRISYFADELNTWFKAKDGGIAFAGKLASAAATMLFFWLASKFVTKLVRNGLQKQQKGSRIFKDFVIRTTGSVVMVVGFMVVLAGMGVELGPMLAAMGAGGFIIGFALQDTLGNFASGMMIMIYQPFDEGDFVEISGVAGKVDKMSLVSTTMLTMDNKELIIPNKKAWGDTITNYSGRKVRRVDLVFGISYSDDIDKALVILAEVANTHSLVLKEPILQTGVHSLGDSSVNLLLRPWVKTVDYWDVYWDLTKMVKQRFDLEGVSIPFPQQDIHVYHRNIPIPEGQ
ncbi:mechanosensitive ion channel family protein [Rubritalea sp.]|uniref:mechanosensitive ion channel family protein n=1 Tax=Rubritalea sp. TaxID=2109375 RepID=UPI003EF6F048